MYVLIVLENLGMSFGERWLFKNVNLQINQGDRIGLVGKNGTGKTTLLKLIAGELEPTEGQIHRSSNIEIHRQEQIHDSDMLAGELLKITSDSQELPQKERLRRSLLNSLGFK
ncbi:MAG TPA: ATP-binding cassette domain-containing protein, partial [Kosmotoga arenicorallina]|nr:ATP-binding cassette domain-containing protein [Kosmotoga arenicorallina]